MIYTLTEAFSAQLLDLIEDALMDEFGVVSYCTDDMREAEKIQITLTRGHYRDEVRFLPR